MIDENEIEIKTDQLSDSFGIENVSIERMLEKITDYLQSYSDQRKKPSETHGLDKWAHDMLSLDNKEYSDAERKILRKHFERVEKKIIEKAKSILGKLVDDNRTVIIEEFLRKPFRDELKAYICQTIADRQLTDYKEGLINLYLKGTQKSSQAALDCMRTLKDVSFYYPIKQLQPSRYNLTSVDLKVILNDFKESHLEIQLAEAGFQAGDLREIDDALDIPKFCEVLIGLDYKEQKLVCHNLKNRFKEPFEQIGKQLQYNYNAIGQIKTKDYKSSLKRATGDSLMIGGWDISASIETLLARNIASIKEMDYIERIFESLDVKYRHKFLKSVLNPPKHIKDEFGKKRLIWIYNQLHGKFKNDFEKFENFIKWHIGNDDIDIKIETMLLMLSLSQESEKDIIQNLKDFSQDDRYKEYHDRINAILPDESLLIVRKELDSLSNTALESKLSIVLNKKSVTAHKQAAETLCDYLKEVHGARFEFVFNQILYLIQNKPEKKDDSVDGALFDAAVDILVKDINKDDLCRHDFILWNRFFLDYFCDHYPKSNKGISEGLIAIIFKNCFSIHAGPEISLKLALQLSLSDDQNREIIWAEWINQVVADRTNITQLIELLMLDEKKHVFENVLLYISQLKNKLKKSEHELIEVNENMQKRIVNEILPQLIRAKQRAGEQPLLTENYEIIISILADYIQKAHGDKNGKSKSIEGYENLIEFETNSSLLDFINKISTLPMTERDQNIRVFIESKYTSNQFDELLNESPNIPKSRHDWFTYRLIDFVLDQLTCAGNLFQSFRDEKLLWGTTNKMLFRTHEEYQLTLKQILLSRNNKLKEIGRLIGEYLEKIEINLFGYYEMTESLSKMGLERIFNKPGEIISRDKLDLKRHKVLPSQIKTDTYQVITLGLKLPSDEIIKEAYLESKDQ